MKLYRAKQGDTFETVAEAKGIRVSSLIAANEKISPDKLSPGQILRIPEPEPVEEMDPEPVPVQMPEPEPEPEPEPVEETEPEPVEETEPASELLVTVPRSYLAELNRLAEIGRAYLNAHNAIMALPEMQELHGLVCPNT